MLGNSLSLSLGRFEATGVISSFGAAFSAASATRSKSQLFNFRPGDFYRVMSRRETTRVPFSVLSHVATLKIHIGAIYPLRPFINKASVEASERSTAFRPLKLFHPSKVARLPRGTSFLRRNMFPRKSISTAFPWAPTRRFIHRDDVSLRRKIGQARGNCQL